MLNDSDASSLEHRVNDSPIEAVGAQRAFRTAVPFIAMVVFALHALLLGRWLIDDAGISFAYARNFAHGYGLTAQPGAVPIEGYSNFLWVMLLTPFYLTNTFDDVLTPKILSLVLTTLTFVVLARALTKDDEMSPWVILVSLCLAALQPAFVIWSMSGLENPLYVLLISCLFVMTLTDVSKVSNGQAIGARRLLGAGALAASIALTRPDGLIYIVAYPAALLGFIFFRRRTRPATSQEVPFDWIGHLAIYGIGYVVVFGAFLISRLVHFHQWWPNTYYAKGGPSFETLRNILLLHQSTTDALLGLLGSAIGWPTLWALLLPLAATFYLMRHGALRPAQALLLLFLAISTAGYLLLPPDWMPWFRFATPVYLFLYLYVVSLAAGILRCVNGGSSMPLIQRRYVTGVVLASFAILAFVQMRGTLKFMERPTTPLARVSEIFGRRFNRCADLTGVANPSVLLPDLGGTLLYSKLRVYDLAGLCDRTIATVGVHKKRLYDYVFETTRPTFIHVHGWWTRFTNLDADPRLARDYILIHRLNNPEHDWRDYVRRDAIGQRAELVSALDAAIRGSTIPAPSPDRQRLAQSP